MPSFLLTNDDGVFADGLLALKHVASEFGKVTTVAPMQEQSGKSHSITLHRPLRVNRIDPDTYGIEGTPADSVLLALRTLLNEQPDWVLSGINPGGNLGNDTLYSGTVAAVIEAASMGRRGVAFSIHGTRPFRLDTAQSVVRKVLWKLASLNLPEMSCVNVNIPNIPFSEIKGFRTATLGRRLYDERIHERQDPRDRPYYWIGSGAPDSFVDIPGSDCNLVDAGYVSVSVLRVDYFNKPATDALSQEVAQWGDRK